ncbi:unnamed protein product, partial [Dibothriocephalus latus]
MLRRKVTGPEAWSEKMEVEDDAGDHVPREHSLEVTQRRRSARESVS